jgi:iron complex transport system substrate-binding protein
VRALALACLLVLFAAASAEARRIVSIGGAVTEIAFALGAGDEIVAVDTTSLWPPEADDLPDIGYMRRLSAEPILALVPDLVLASAGSGPRPVLEQLASAGIAVAMIPDEPSIEGIYGKVEAVARALGREAEGKRLKAEIAAAFADAAQAVTAVAPAPRVLFVIGMGRGAPQAAGHDTAADAIIRLAGGTNAVTGYAGYRPLNPEAAIAAAPDLILTMTQTVEALGGSETLLARPEIGLTPAGAAGRLVALDGLLLLGFGPRTPEAVRELAGSLARIADAKPLGDG